MSHRRAKRLRQHIWKGTNKQVKVAMSCGAFFRLTTKYGLRKNTPSLKHPETYRIQLLPNCPRAVVARAKEYIRSGKRLV
jgi:hypothetical protein